MLHKRIIVAVKNQTISAVNILPENDAEQKRKYDKTDEAELGVTKIMLMNKQEGNRGLEIPFEKSSEDFAHTMSEFKCMLEGDTGRISVPKHRIGLVPYKAYTKYPVPHTEPD